MPARLITTRRKSHANLVQLFDTSVQIVALRQLRETAVDLRDRVQTTILDQTESWPPLNPAYLRRKVNEGFDPRMLVRTKEYVSNIRAFPVVVALPHLHVRVGVPIGVHNSGMTFGKLAGVHEYGTQPGSKVQIPARPHWRPVWSQFSTSLGQFKQTLRRGILFDLRGRLA